MPSRGSWQVPSLHSSGTLPICCDELVETSEHFPGRHSLPQISLVIIWHFLPFALSMHMLTPPPIELEIPSSISAGFPNSEKLDKSSPDAKFSPKAWLIELEKEKF